jgi:hypothetical protein
VEVEPANPVKESGKRKRRPPGSDHGPGGIPEEPERKINYNEGEEKG